MNLRFRTRRPASDNDASSGQEPPVRTQPVPIGEPTTELMLGLAQLPSVGPEPDPAMVRLSAEQTGLGDAQAGALDEFSFPAGNRLPYDGCLDTEERGALAANRIRRATAEQIQHDLKANRAGQLAAARAQEAQLASDAETFQEHETACREELDVIQQKSRGPRGAGTWAGGVGEPEQRRRRRDLLFLFLGGLLVLLDFALQLDSFLDFSPSLPVRVLLAGGVTLVMVLLPHLAGRLLRSRSAPGAAAGVELAAAIGIGVVWLPTAFGLARLRAGILTRDFDGPGGVAPALDALGMGYSAAVLLFAGLILLTGLFGFAYGLMREHPAIANYRNAVAVRVRAQQHLNEVRKEIARLEAVEEEELEQALDEAHAAADQRTRETYSGGRAAYRQGAARAMGQPAFTEAASHTDEPHPVTPEPAP
ncbi:hypothetical protein GCM10027569_20900 [Flindersiella endophytica]